jgi:uncharacterized protein YdhG (YjbR/CyaY superfamily)
MKLAETPARSTKTVEKRRQGFTSEERAAMRARAKETKAEALKVDGEKEVLAAIAEMSEPDRSMAMGLHGLIKASAPRVAPRTWYGMPAYAIDGNTICFFKPAEKFKERFATFGFTDKAKLDDGAMWPKEYALTKLTPAEEKRIGALVRKAVS